MKAFVRKVEKDLIPQLSFQSVDPCEPIKVFYYPSPWRVIGMGNYAAVFMHPDYDNIVVKIYAPGREGLKEEVDVYKKIGKHDAYSQCLCSGDNYLILKRLQGITLFDCLNRGIFIPEKVILDIDEALCYAKARGLFPHDVHGKNVMMHNGAGIVADISDFNKQEFCPKWNDLKRSYYKFYKPLFSRHCIKVPYPLLDFTRKLYRIYSYCKKKNC